MERRVADILNQATARFYQSQATSFSDTRKAAWPGWLRCAEHLGKLGSRVRLFDLACGNLRFERFLERELPGIAWAFSAVDSCDDLVVLGSGLSDSESERRSSGGGPASGGCGLSGDGSSSAGSAPAVLPFSSAGSAPVGPSLSSAASVLSSAFEYQQLDVVSALLDEAECLGLGYSGLFDACVSFGFFHHVPGACVRERALRDLVGQLRPGGLAMVSLWQFEKSEQILAQAQELRPMALADLRLNEDDLEPGDYLLGWKRTPGVYRYCHSFSMGEVNRLLDAVADVAEPVDVFESDGRTGDLNAYVVLRHL